MSGLVYPSSHSDVQCGECLLYFRFDGDLISHREADHGRPAASRECNNCLGTGNDIMARTCPDCAGRGILVTDRPTGPWAPVKQGEGS